MDSAFLQQELEKGNLSSRAGAEMADRISVLVLIPVDSAARKAAGDYRHATSVSLQYHTRSTVRSWSLESLFVVSNNSFRDCGKYLQSDNRRTICNDACLPLHALRALVT